MIQSEIETLIRRIRIAASFGIDLDTLHTEIVVNGCVSEEDFFLAYRAASILDGEK